MAETTNNNGVNTQANGSESTQMTNGVGATYSERNLAKIRECLQERNNVLIENAHKNVDTVLDIIFNAVEQDPVFYLTERKVVITFSGFHANLNGFTYLTDLKGKANLMELDKYSPAIYESISSTPDFLINIQATAFANTSPAFECYVTDAEIFSSTNNKSKNIKRFMVVLDLDAI